MASINGITGENAQNLPEIEKQWAVKAYEHAETYYKLLCEVEPFSLKLTKIDEELYLDFRKNFPDMNIARLVPENINATEDIKAKWRAFILPYEKRIALFNFGTLLRLDADKDYSEQNSYFVTRTQFYAIEVARNKEGLNDDIYQKYQDQKQH